MGSKPALIELFVGEHNGRHEERRTCPNVPGHSLPRLLLLALFVLATVGTSRASGPDLSGYEGRRIESVTVDFEGSPPDPAIQSEFLALLKIGPGTDYSVVKVHDSLQALFDSGRVANGRVEVTEVRTGGPVRVRFVVQRQIVITDIKFVVSPTTGPTVTTEELSAKLNLVRPGARFSRQALLRNIDEIQNYLHDRGYFSATVEPSQQLDPSGVRATVTYRINLGEPARVSAFNIDISGLNGATLKPTLTLQSGVAFTRQALNEDLDKIRKSIIASGHLAPRLDDARVQRDPETNQITIRLTGTVGPSVDVKVENYKISDKTAHDILPVRREGSIEQSAIVEGARRLRNRLQEEGYFFAEVTPICAVTPPLNGAQNGTSATCEVLNPVELDNHTIAITYQVVQGRRFRLADIRITGTDKLSFPDVEAELKSQKTNALNFIPFLSYGRGYTSIALLEQDKRTIVAHMRDLGYRRASVEVLQGVSIAGEDLIITFRVTEGPLTRVAGIDVRGNRVFTDARLRRELRTIIGAPYSKSITRSDADNILNLYALNGYVDAEVTPSVVDLPKQGNDEQVRVIYAIKAEGDKVFINRIIVNGLTGGPKTQRTKRDAVVRATPLREGEILRADRINEAERALFATDAYAQVLIHTEPAGETSSGFKKRDVVIDVEEKKPRVMDYGGGYSTDTGPSGLFEISNVNLMNKLRQGAIRLRASRRQQSVRFEYLDPHFVHYGGKQFAPLALTLQYRRDSTVTRFFRSAIDRGTFGIVQRLDAKGNPIDEFGSRTGEPTINRFTFTAETQRVLSEKTRSAVFARYSYDDVRLYNLESLVIRDILIPDRAIRLSRFGGSYVRDTRERCEPGIPRNNDEATGAPGEVCRYNQLDATRGDFFNVDYAVALTQLGSSMSFNKLLASYRHYYKLNSLRNTVLAGNFTLGLSNVINPRDRDRNGRIDEIDRTLPISERFFSGGSTTLRGFNFEEAGPRVVVIPQGIFLDRDKKPIVLNPFTVPVGGNALAVLNLEARIPLRKELQAVPFYDGGNVFRRAGDLFGKHEPITGNTLVDRINAINLRAHWTNTVGLGFRIQTPVGGAVAVDYGFLLNPPEFLIPQKGPTGQFDGAPAIYRLNRGQIQFRFTQTF